MQQGFSLKPSHTGSSTPSVTSVDWNAINSQVKTDNHLAIISQIVDLGQHIPEVGIATDKTSTFATQAEALAFIEDAKTKLSKVKAAALIAKPVAEGFEVNAKYTQPKERQEVAIFADLVDCIVDYGGDIGKKPFRVLLNKSFKGDIRGLGLTQVPPSKTGGVWTFPPASMLTELANVTKQQVIIDGSDKQKLNDIGLLLGQALMVDIVQSKPEDNVYVNVKGVGSVPSMLESHIDRSLVQPFGISFDNATAELLEAAGVRGSVIKKIKTATNYVGSNMQKAVEALEANWKANQNTTDATATKAPVVNQPAPVDDDIPF